jgi:hypothetical protein
MHAHTRDCPLTCLQPLLTTVAYNLLRAECLFICGDGEPAVSHAVRLYTNGQLADIRNIGPVRFAEITACLAHAGLISHDAADQASPPATQGVAATDAEPPSARGRPATPSSRLRTRLITE